jgi:hypothetical protein
MSESDTLPVVVKEVTGKKWHMEMTTRSKLNELQGSKHAPPQDTTPGIIFLYVFIAQQLLNKFVRQNNNYVKIFLQGHHLTPG